MTAREIAEQIRDECVDMCHGDPFYFEAAVEVIAAALAAQQAETREAECGEDHLVGSQPNDCFACLALQCDELMTALKAVTETDDDCPVCDRGRLRNPEKTHWPECPFGKAQILLRALSPTPASKDQKGGSL